MSYIKGHRYKYLSLSYPRYEVFINDIDGVSLGKGVFRNHFMSVEDYRSKKLGVILAK